MAFYIRKAFKTGPIRLNLSKGGLGLSGGITGARVGINSRGTYVHGGRHGFYYRKYMKKGKQASRESRRTVRDDQHSHPSGPVSLFRDTGVTFPSRTVELRKVSRSEPALPSSKLLTLPVTFTIGLALFLFFFSFAEELEWLVIPALLLSICSIGWIGWNGYWKHQAKKALHTVSQKTEYDKRIPEIEILSDEKMPKRWQTWLSLYLHAVIGEMAMRHEEIDTVSTLQSLDKQLPANREIVNKIRVSILGNLLDEMLEDHMLSEEEEQTVRRLIDQLNVPELLISLELERLKHYSLIRKEIERPLEIVDPGIDLVRGENAYEVFEHARLLNERVLNRFQRDNVQYRELGYEIDLEGKLILTDRRVLIVERDSREYRLNRLVDITADPEAGILELVLSNRKSPVLITVEEPMVLAARLEKIIEEKADQ